MKDYKEVKIQCYSFQDMMHIYEMEYKNEYKLIGYQFNSLDHVGGVGVVSKRETLRNVKIFI